MDPASLSSRDQKQALFVLGGWPQPDARGAWHSSLFDNGGIGDRLRVEAAAVLYRSRPQLIVVTGGKGKLAHLAEAVPCASVMKGELIELGVSAADIAEELDAGNTCEQLQFIKTAFARLPVTSLRILSNRYHLPRIGAFLSSDEQLREWCARGCVRVLAAEEILLDHDPARWQKLIAEAYASPAMQERVQQEERGIRDICAGTYRR